VVSRARANEGQASLEWLAVVVLVAALLSLGAALAQAGYVGRQVTREMARALCRVGQGDCERDHEPCVTRSERGRTSLTVNAFFVRLGGGQEALIEQRSDGRVAVTAARSGTFGLEGGFGAGATLKVKGLDVALGGEVQASVLARRDGGRTWIVPTWRDAEDLLGRLRPLHGGAPRPPDVEYGGRDLAATLGVAAGVRGPVTLDAAHGGLTFDRGSGVRIDRRTGRRTVFVDAAATADVTLAGGVLGVSASRSAGGELYAVELDAGGRPVDLQVVAAGTFGVSRDLPDVVQPVVGLLQSGRSEGRRFEVTAHLDLTNPENLAAARALLAAIARRGWRADVPAASRALRRRIDEEGTVEARVLETRSESDDAELHGGAGAKVGGAVHVERASTRLVAATSRGLDGQWLPRADCV
jgi:hypothetical protein